MAELRVWATMDTDGAYEEIASSANRMWALEESAQALCLAPAHVRDGSYTQIYVRGDEVDVLEVLIRCNMRHGVHGFTVDFPSGEAYDRIRAETGGRDFDHLVGIADIEDDLSENKTANTEEA